MAGYPLDLGNGELLLDFDTKRLLVSIAEADLQISSYVFVHGALAFEKTDDVWVTVIGDTTQTRMSVTTIGGQDLTMFFGANGPYWTDLDGDNDISWAFNSGFGDAASRTITAGGVTLDEVLFRVGDVLPANLAVTLTAGDGALTVGSTSYGDINGDGNATGETWTFNTGTGNTASRTIAAGSLARTLVPFGVGDVLPMDVVGTLDADDDVLVFGNAADGTEVRYGNINDDDIVDPEETGELNENAVGVAIVDADLALALLTPQNRKHHALHRAQGVVGVRRLRRDRHLQAGSLEHRRRAQYRDAARRDDSAAGRELCGVLPGRPRRIVCRVRRR